LHRLRGLWLWLDNHDHAGLAVASSVHAAQPLHHALPGDEIRHHVIGIEVNTHLTSRCGNGKCGPRSLDLGARDEAEIFQALRCLLALEHSSPADKELAVHCDVGALGEFLDSCLHSLRVLAFIAEHDAPHRTRPIAGDLPCLLRECVPQLLVLERVHREALRRDEPPDHVGVIQIRVLKPERFARMRPSGGRQREELEGGDELSQRLVSRTEHRVAFGHRL
jgi:hypothetical protein